MISKERFAIGFIIGFILITIYTGINNQKFITEISTSPFPRAILFYLISRVDYLLIIISIFLLKISTPIKEFISGLSLIWALDILSFPRLPIESLPTELAFKANSDFIFMSKILEITNWSYPFAWKFYYIILPIILILLVGYALGVVKFGKKLIGEN